MTFLEVSQLIIIVLLVLIFLIMVGSGTARLGSLQEAGSALKKIRKSKTDCKVAGVCGGFGEHTPIPSWIWRVIFLLLLFCGIGLIAYIIFAICMPSDDHKTS